MSADPPREHPSRGASRQPLARGLIRRRLPRIVILDAEADPAFSFGGLANLVRKARLDFDAHIDFKKGLDQLRPSHTPCGFATRCRARTCGVRAVPPLLPARRRGRTSSLTRRSGRVTGGWGITWGGRLAIW